MGTYINKGNNAFRDIVNSEYVDKTSLIPIINKTLNTECRYSCVSRSRRFGKSMAAKMLCAYYDKSCDSRELFMGLKVEKDKTFEEYLNKYTVIYLDVTSFTARPELGDKIVRTIQNEIISEVKKCYPDVDYSETTDLMGILSATKMSCCSAACSRHRIPTKSLPVHISRESCQLRGITPSRH